MQEDLCLLKTSPETGATASKMRSNRTSDLR
jgi:hypothetical protein